MDSTGRSRGSRSGGDTDPGAAPDETAPLLQSPGARTPVGDDEASTDEDDIDPNEFDMMLSKSLSYTGGGFLEPEPTEYSMLRGPRRYSVSGGRGRPRKLSIASRHRRPSSTAAVVDETAAAGEAEAAISSSSSAASSEGAGGAQQKSNNPYLGGVSVARFWVIFGEILATYFLACFDSTIMASSHPVITSYFGASNSASWLSTAFLLTSTSFQPLLGRLSDTLGRKGPYVATMVVFLVATLWCAAAQSMASFIAARAVCGLGAGGMMTMGSITLSDLVPIE